MQSGVGLGGGGEVVRRLLWDLFRDVLKVFYLCGHSGHKPRFLPSETMIQNESSEVSKGPPPYAAHLAAAILLFCAKEAPSPSCTSHPQEVLLSPLFHKKLQVFFLSPFLFSETGSCCVVLSLTQHPPVSGLHAAILGMPLND